MSEEVYPLAVLIDELRHDDVGVRVSAMSRVSTIAAALGEQRTRNELMPFLDEVAQEDEDEILVVLADELAKFVPLVGGPEYAHTLIPVLATLAPCEEPTVRDAAVHALIVVGEAMTPDEIEQHFIPLVHRLSTADWFSNRISAAALYGTLLSKVPDARVLNMYKDLVTDDAPMVRRAAATHLPHVIEELPQGAPYTEGPLADMFSALVVDDQDSVRLLSVDVVIALATKVPEDVNTQLVDRTMDLMSDKSWRVRYMAADRFEQLARAVSRPDLTPKFVAHFVTLCKDSEAEVRTAIAKRVVGFCELLTPDIIVADIVPTLEALTEDMNEHVREALATQISYMSTLLGHDKAVEYLLPLFLQMLRDEHSEVRLQIISNLQIINKVIGIDMLSQSLLPAISELAKDKQWRVLLAIIDYSPLLAQQLGVDFFNKELVPLVMQWLWDPVWAIRDAAAANLVKLADVFGATWLETQIVPKIVVAEPQANYLYRLTSLLAVKTITPALSVPVLENTVLPFVLTMMGDPVPNIRFNCAKAFQVLASTLLEKSPDTRNVVQDTIMHVLEKHTEDMDVDVRFYVNGAIDSISGQLVAH